MALWGTTCKYARKYTSACTHSHTSSNTNLEDSSLISLQRRGMRGMQALKECRRIDGKHGGTGKVIKNWSYRCFRSTSKWCAWPCQRLGMMHYWDGAHLAPGADITPPVHLAAHVSRGRHFGSHLSALTQLPVWWRASGKAAHMLRADLKGTELGHVQPANLAPWIKSEEAGKLCESLKCMSSPALHLC